jgi:hypothetical protein
MTVAPVSQLRDHAIYSAANRNSEIDLGKGFASKPEIPEKTLASNVQTVRT